MAMVLDALAPYVKKMIKEMTEAELTVPPGISSEMEKFGENVGKLEVYLTDAERRRIDDGRVQGWVSKLKDALYEATDILDLCQLDAEGQEKKKTLLGGGGGGGCLRPLLLLLCLQTNPAFAHSIGRRIMALNVRLDEIRKEMVDFRFKPLPLTISSSSPLTSDATLRSRMATTPSLNGPMADAVIGNMAEEEARALVQFLLTNDNEPTIKVVSIEGVGGIGKTTLAKKIFSDKAIQLEFRHKIWLSVTENSNYISEENLLRSAIAMVGGHPGSGDKQVLADTLTRILSTAKFLIVMDDLRSDGAWAHALRTPVLSAARDQPGSRVIVTTRNPDLVKHMGVDYHQYHVKPMCDEDAWSLLKKQMLPLATGSESAIDPLKDTGLEIIRKCGHLPLAIKLLGGLLSMKRANENEWNGVLNDAAWSTDKTHDGLMSSALRLCYEDMSPQLKQCFLYCSLFSQEEAVVNFDVLWMWISEGFLQVPPGDDQRSPTEAEDIGERYYMDLITRNLLEPAALESIDGLVRRMRLVCRMHNVVHSFAHYMATEEGALVILPVGQVNPQVVPSKQLRRLSIFSPKFESPPVVLPEWSSISGKQEMLRSLIINGNMNFEASTSGSSSLTLSRFPSLRVLVVCHANSDRLAESITKMKHLRLLCFKSTDISRLPGGMDKLKLLQHIILDNCENFAGQFPRSILKLVQLRNVSIIRTRFVVPKGFSGLTNLRALGEFPVQMDGEWCSLQELGPLSQLRALVLLDLEAVPSSLLAAKAKIRDKEQLTSLVLLSPLNPPYDKDDSRRVEDVFDQLCPPSHLEALVIDGYIGRRAPSWMCASVAASPSSCPWVDSSRLRKLTMVGLPFCTQLPDCLCRLTSLEDLVIEFALFVKRVGPEFQKGCNMAGPSFPVLQNLVLSSLRRWEEWEWEEADALAMPSLHSLRILSCRLGRLPPGLASSRRRTLRELVLVDLSMITALMNFPSVATLIVQACPTLNIIAGFDRMCKISIVSCPGLEVLEGVPVLEEMLLADPTMVMLPTYLKGLKLKSLEVCCHQSLRDILLLPGPDDPCYCAEMQKVKDCGKLIVHAIDRPGDLASRI